MPWDRLQEHPALTAVSASVQAQTQVLGCNYKSHILAPRVVADFFHVELESASNTQLSPCGMKAAPGETRTEGPAF